MLTLRPYQIETIDKTRALLRQHNSVLIQSPTASGKTILSAKMLGKAAERGKRSFFICHRIELIEQTSEKFRAAGIPHGFIAAGMRPNPFQPVQICSINTLKSRVDKIKPPDFCIWDEAHHVAAGGWAKIHARYSNAKHVGLTATPERLDSKGLGEWFSAMVEGPSVAWLIKEGYLSDYKIYAPSTPDLTGVHKRMGDYAKGELSEAMDKNYITGCAIQHYQRLAPGKRAVVFCVSVKHSMRVAEQFRAAGIMAVHIDGKSKREDRRAAIQGFRAGTIQVISNVEIINEGFDLPEIEVGILLRPTYSLAFYLQMVGRILRRGKPYAIILDHANLAMRHGLPDDEREWTLEGRKHSKASQKPEVSVRQCPDCFHVHKIAAVCPECGKVYEVVGRLPEQVEGELVEMDKAKLRQRAKYEQGKARTLDELVALGKRRGYASPHGWAAFVYTSRQAKRGK